MRIRTRFVQIRNLFGKFVRMIENFPLIRMQFGEAKEEIGEHDYARQSLAGNIPHSRDGKEKTVDDH